MNATTASPTVMDRLTEIGQELPTFFSVILAALIPIYTGAHASLSRPSSAAKPNKTKKKSKSGSNQKMEGLSPIDALLYPIMAGMTLASLYYLIKWLEDPTILEKLMNYYLTAFGTVAIWGLVRDSCRTVADALWPQKYSADRNIWMVDVKEKKFVSGSESRDSPLPGLLSRIQLPAPIRTKLWKFHEAQARPPTVINITAKYLGDCTIDIDNSTIFATLISFAAVLYYNLYAKPWWLINLFGFSFCYSAFQMLSPTTFWTGTLILTSLFFYDIYFVFYTPMMITVATKLDIPAKLLIPRRVDSEAPDPGRSHSLLGLGDVVLPGIMLGLALRFDLFMFYLKKQKTINNRVVKAEYASATGSWGERLWLSSSARKTQGYSFPKPYFNAGITGYILGLLITQCIMIIFHHGQPALLYLVPSVLGSLWGTAYLRGDIKEMWQYSEDAEDWKKDKKKVEEPPIYQDITDETGEEVKTVEEIKKTGGRMRRASWVQEARMQKDPDSMEERRIFSITISRPEDVVDGDDADLEKKEE